MGCGGSGGFGGVVMLKSGDGCGGRVLLRSLFVVLLSWLRMCVCGRYWRGLLLRKALPVRTRPLWLLRGRIGRSVLRRGRRSLLIGRRLCR